MEKEGSAEQVNATLDGARVLLNIAQFDQLPGPSRRQRTYVQRQSEAALGYTERKPERCSRPQARHPWSGLFAG